MFAGNFLKDITGNNSINMLGNKLKTSWLPDAKDMLASAQSQITAEYKSLNSAINATGLTNASSSSTINQNMESVSHLQDNSIVNSSKKLTGTSAGTSISTNAVTSISGNESGISSNYKSQQQQQQPQQQSLASKRNPIDSSATPPINSFGQQQQLPTQTKPKQQPQPPTQQTQQTPRRRSQSSNLGEITQNIDIQSQKNAPTIDPLQYNALMETNEALKSELQRLSVFELKCKALEKEAKTSKALKEANEKLETDLKQLSTYKTNYEKLEAELNLIKSNRNSESRKLDSYQKELTEKMDRLESENSNLKNKINDLDRLVFEYDEKYNDIKSKEQSLESQNKHLENELDRMAEELNEARTNANNASFQNNYSENNSNNEMHSQKLLAIEQANRILEEELETLKEQQKSERAKVKEKMELLNHKQSDRIKKLEEENKILEEKLVDRKLDESSTIHLFQKQCEDLRKRIKELESFEAENMELQNTMNKLKNELKFLQNLNSDEKKRLENEKRKLEDINSLNEKLNETIKNEARNHDQEKHEFETKLKRIENVLEKKDNELSELKKLKEIDTSNFLSKLSILNDENLSLTSQLKAMSNNISQKDGEINNMSKKVGELSKENEKLQSQLKSYLNLENELVDVHMKNTEAKERIHDLEAKLGDLERRYNKDLTDSKNSNSQQIKQLKQELTDEILKYENLHTEFSLLKLEINKLNQFKIKCDYLEKELAESRANKLQKINEYEANTKKYYEAGDKLENENRLLVAQLTSMQKDLMVKDQEYKQLEKLYEAERHKTLTLLKQIDDLNAANSQLSMQNSDAKRRLISLDLLSEECNQLRKNLTLMTIEAESRKAESATLSSQINKLEGTVRSMRESSDKHSHFDLNYENAAYELKKKNDEYKRLQQLHDSVKKEQLDTIELLEEKLRDVEKKTELQALKHEEILLELESIGARRERLLPMCPNCSTQTIPMYQSHHCSVTQPPSQMNSPPMQHHSAPATHLSFQSNQNQSQSPHLLSISIPQQSLSPSLISSPVQLQQLQAHIPNLQLISIPGKNSVTVECQTSPTKPTPQNDTQSTKIDMAKNEQLIQSQQQQIIELQRKLDKKPISVPKANVYSQTIEIKTPSKVFSNKDINTDPITFHPPPPPKKITKNQAVNVDLFAEAQAKIVKKVFEEKGTQSTQELQPIPVPLPHPPPEPEKSIPILLKEKYFLYTCKYSYDPFKNSPNDNPEAELPLIAGDYLFILNEEDEDGFYTGELLNGQRGLVPSNFVERVNLEKNNLNKYLLTELNLPKTLLTNSKFGECLVQQNLDAGHVFLSAQELIENLKQTLNDFEANALKQNQVKSSNALTNLGDVLSTEINATSVKIGVPYPNNLKVEKQTDNQILVSWDAPTAPLSLNQSIESDNLPSNEAAHEQTVHIQTYNVYLNNELYISINGQDERICILKNIDLTIPNRVSIQAITNKGATSKPQECTLLFGSNRSLAPSNLNVNTITLTSAIVSWWPSSSLFSHIISIDSIEHRTLKPGIFRFKLSGLLPDTSHLVIVNAQILNHSSEQSLAINNNYSASVEFRTLASKSLSIPQNFNLERDPYETDTFILSWNPVCTMSNTVSNGISVGGYSIYLDGMRLHQILNPTASTVNLTSKLLFNNGAKLLTIRTLSLDGNTESKDSEPIKLANFLNIFNQVNNNNEIEEKKFKPVQQPQPQPQSQPQLQPQSQLQPQPQIQPQPQQTPIALKNQQIVGNNSLINQNIETFIPNTINKKISGNVISGNQSQINDEVKKPTPIINKPVQQNTPVTQSQIDTYNNSNQQNHVPAQVSQPKKIPNSVPKAQIPLMSEISKKNLKNERVSGDNSDADLYENSKSFNPTTTTIKQKPSPIVNPNNPKQVRPINAEKKQPTPINNNLQQKKSSGKENEVISNTKNPKSNRNNGVSKGKADANFRVFIALFDYDPFKMSPNKDSCQEELPFKEGQLIKIFGEQDSDGFFYGEAAGRSGYIPCNMVSELQVDDPEVVKQLLNDSSNAPIKQGSNQESLNPKRSSKSNTTTNQSNVNPSTKTKVGKTGIKSQNIKEQSFVPINNQKNTVTQVMVALYDYDPQSLSPNADADAELPFRTGDIINVIGNMDEDGFFMAELNGKRGLVPSNFLQPVQSPNDKYSMRSNEHKKAVK